MKAWKNKDERNHRSKVQSPPPPSHLDQLGGEAPGDEDPVGCGDQAVGHHRAEEQRAQPPPLLAEVVRVDLSGEDGQDHGQHGHQVHLPPVLGRRGDRRGARSPSGLVYTHTHTTTDAAKSRITVGER